MFAEIKRGVDTFLQLTYGHVKASVLPPEKESYFRETLIDLLWECYADHCISNDQKYSPGYLRLHIDNGEIDCLLLEAAGRIELRPFDICLLFPQQITVWMDPGKISYQIGRGGSVAEEEVIDPEAGFLPGETPDRLYEGTGAFEKPIDCSEMLQYYSLLPLQEQVEQLNENGVSTYIEPTVNDILSYCFLVLDEYYETNVYDDSEDYDIGMSALFRNYGVSANLISYESPVIKHDWPQLIQVAENSSENTENLNDIISKTSSDTPRRPKKKSKKSREKIKNKLIVYPNLLGFYKNK